MKTIFTSVCIVLACVNEAVEDGPGLEQTCVGDESALLQRSTFQENLSVGRADNIVQNNCYPGCGQNCGIKWDGKSCPWDCAEADVRTTLKRFCLNFPDHCPDKSKNATDYECVTSADNIGCGYQGDQGEPCKWDCAYERFKLSCYVGACGGTFEGKPCPWDCMEISHAFKCASGEGVPGSCGDGCPQDCAARRFQNDCYGYGPSPEPQSLDPDTPDAYTFIGSPGQQCPYAHKYLQHTFVCPTVDQLKSSSKSGHDIWMLYAAKKDGVKYNDKYKWNDVYCQMPGPCGSKEDGYEYPCYTSCIIKGAPLPKCPYDPHAPPLSELVCPNHFIMENLQNNGLDVTKWGVPCVDGESCGNWLLNGSEGCGGMPCCVACISTVPSHFGMPVKKSQVTVPYDGIPYSEIRKTVIAALLAPMAEFIGWDDLFADDTVTLGEDGIVVAQEVASDFAEDGGSELVPLQNMRGQIAQNFEDLLR